MQKHLRRKHTNKSKRWNAHTLRTHQNTLNIMGTLYHTTVNHLQRGFCIVRVAFVNDSDPTLPIVVHPALDCAALFGRERFTDIIDPDIARADDERHTKAAFRERAVPIMRDGVRHRDARWWRVEHMPARALEE